MNKKIFFILFSLTLLFSFSTPVMSQSFIREGVNVIDNEINLSNEDPRKVTVRIINVVLTFLSIIALVVVLFGGFKWMTSGGNQENVASAKKILIAGLIGLIIILISWGITAFVINQVANVATYP